MLQVKRVYEQPSADDGYRVLVDRLWPRGLAKEQAAIDEWLKEVAPSAELRRWFGHDPAKFAEFSRRYHEELSENKGLAKLQRIVKSHKRLTLVYGARDQEYNHAVILRDVCAGLE